MCGDSIFLRRNHIKKRYFVREDKRQFWTFVALLFVAGVSSTSPFLFGPNAESRLAAAQALVEYNTYCIDSTEFVGTLLDKVYINGHYYCDKPPMSSLMASAVYLPLYHLGLRLGRDFNGAYYVITLLTVRLAWVWGVIAFYLLLGYTPLDNRQRIRLALVTGFGSLYFCWSSVFNSHAMSASFLIIAFLFIFRAKRNLRPSSNLFWGGLFSALAWSLDIPLGIAWLGFASYIAADTNMRKHIPVFLVPLLVTVVPSLAIIHHISGSIVPFQVQSSFYMWPGSPWQKADLSGITSNSPVETLRYGFFALFGSNGFIVYSPLLVFAIPGLVKQIKERQTFRKEAVLVASVTAAFFLYYFLFTNNYGGCSYSIRWFVPILPLLYFFLYPWFTETSLEQKTTWRLIFNVVIVISIIIAVVGLINPWTVRKLCKVSFIANVMQLWMYVCSTAAERVTFFSEFFK